MTMQALAELLEQELEEAVEVKNRQSLHRYITLLTESWLKKEDYRDSSSLILSELKDLKSDIRMINDRMESNQRQMDLRFDTMHRMTEERFAAMDKRFETEDKRFDDVNKRFEAVDKRFDDVNKRFDDVNKRFDDVNKRFDDVNKRFGMMFAFMSLGFVVISLLVTVFPKLL
jgi:flagellar capping protein FliD